MKDKSAYKMTVIMPSYNNGKYIRQALDSILNQKVDFSYQIIITDDASQDDSAEIIKEYENRYLDRILAIYSDKNCRLFCNYLKAVEKMDSEYFCVLDPDDYWTDEYRLQKAVDFLDENPDYTIYATNLHKLYNDGTTELKYNYPGLTTRTSTYEDYLHQKAVFSCTPASTYRNIYYSDGIPKEFMDLKGSLFQESFRADTGRNLIHLKRGKLFFVNESIGVCRVHGKGLNSSLSESEKCIEAAYDNIGYYLFFGKENFADYFQIIKQRYTASIRECYRELLNGKFKGWNEEHTKWFNYISDWLKEQKTEYEAQRISFSLELFSRINDMQLIIWGTGSAAEKLIEKYNIRIRENTLFVDNNTGRQGEEFLGRKIIAPYEIKDYKDAIVIPASGYYREIIRQIRDEALCSDDRILNLCDYEINFV